MLQVHEQQQSGVMRLKGEIGRATIWFDGGELVDASSGKLQGVQAVFRALRLEKGSYVVEFGEPKRETRIDAPLPSLVSEGSRRAEQCHLLTDKLPPFGQLLTVNSSRLGPLDEEQRQLVQLFDPHCSISEALDLSDAGELETMMLLDQLVETGTLEPASGKPRYSPDEVTAEIKLPLQPEPKVQIAERPRPPRHADDDEDTAIKEIPRRPSVPVRPSEPPVALQRPSAPPRRSSEPAMVALQRPSPPPPGPSTPPPARRSSEPAMPAVRRPSPPAPERPQMPRHAPDDETTAVKERPVFHDALLNDPATVDVALEDEDPTPVGSRITPAPEQDPPTLDEPTMPGLRSSELVSPSKPAQDKKRLKMGLGLLALGCVVLVGYLYRAEIQQSSNASPAPTVAPTVASATASTAATAATAAPACAQEMVLLKGRTFKMGSSLNKGMLQAAYPPHEVEVGDVCMDRTEVTLAAYETCVERGGCSGVSAEASWPKTRRQSKSAWEKSLERHSEQCNSGKVARGSHPVNCVSWNQADSYCRWRKARLPTEAEWELAARGKPTRLHPWGPEPPTAERMNGCGKECERWYERAGLSDEVQGTLYNSDDGYADTAPVGSFELGATPDGLLDMSGNVSEWVSEPFRAYPDPEGDKRAKADPARRVIRGSAFDSEIIEQSVPALRRALPVDARTPNVGFRCAADPSKG